MQQFSFIDLFIDLLESVLHVSADKTRPSSGALLTVHTGLVQCTDIAADGRVCRPNHVEQIQINQ